MGIKPDWKKKCLEAEGLLKLARDGNDVLVAENEVLRAQLCRTTIQWTAFPSTSTEKIVTKEVVPQWIYFLLAICLLATSLVGTWQRVQIKKLQTPILSPYAVYITKAIPDPKVRLAWTALRHHRNAVGAEVAWKILDR